MEIKPKPQLGELRRCYTQAAGNGRLAQEIRRGKHYARDLDCETAYALYRAMLAGDVPELELGALLIAMRIKMEVPDELLGFYQVMKEQVDGSTDARITAAAHRHPKLQWCA